MVFVKRQDKVMFMETIADEFKRMKGFKTLSTDKNPIEYTRQYVDEDFETTDVVAISTSTEFEFDQIVDDAVHMKMVDIIDGEKLGEEATINLLQVSMIGDDITPRDAVKRSFAVIPGSEGADMNAYTYGGTFRVKGDRILGTATTTDDWLSATFVETV